MTPEEILEHDERIAIEQESCNLEIDIVRRDTQTGELVEEPKRKEMSK